VKCTVHGETVTKLYTAFLATYPPVGSMIRVVLVDEDYGSIGEAQQGFSESADGVVFMNLCISIVLWCLSFVNMYLSLFVDPRCNTAVIHTACSLAPLKLLAVASTSLGKGSAFGAAVKSTDRRLRQTDGAGRRLAADEAPRS